VKTLGEREGIPVYQFKHKGRKDDIANNFRRQRQVRDGIVFIVLESRALPDAPAVGPWLEGLTN
jgi:hypothetical protein